MAGGTRNALMAVVGIVLILAAAWFAYRAGYFLGNH
jgi:LPXTG-motif cell wall-anchored protein